MTRNIFTLAASGTVTAANLNLANAAKSGFLKLGDNSNGPANMESNQIPGSSAAAGDLPARD